MISTRYRFIYLHAPKTGGNSLQSVLLPFSDDHKSVAPGFSGIDRFGVLGPVTPSKHCILQDYYQRLGPVIADFAIALSIRHPYHRLVSFYFSPHRWQPVERPSDMVTPYFDEAEFLAVARDLTPMAAYIAAPAGVRVQPNFLRFETLGDDFRSFLHLIGLAGTVDGALPHVNKSAASGKLSEEILASRELKQMVEPYLLEDLEAFSYQL